MNTSKSLALKDILRAAVSFKQAAIDKAWDEFGDVDLDKANEILDGYIDTAAAAIVEAVEGIYGDSDGLREFASTGSNQVVTPSEAANGCPCLLVEPCSYACTCAKPFMSGGCMRCAKYGSKEQRVAAAKRLAQCNDMVATDKEARNG